MLSWPLGGIRVKPNQRKKIQHVEQQCLQKRKLSAKRAYKEFVLPFRYIKNMR